MNERNKPKKIKKRFSWFVVFIAISCIIIEIMTLFFSDRLKPMAEVVSISALVVSLVVAAYTMEYNKFADLERNRPKLVKKVNKSSKMDLDKTVNEEVYHLTAENFIIDNIIINANYAYIIYH